MTLPITSPSPELSPEEWEEAQALRRAISEHPASVAPWKMERFTALFSRSLLGKQSDAPQ
jgi:hypothetical protein